MARQVTEAEKSDSDLLAQLPCFQVSLDVNLRDCMHECMARDRCAQGLAFVTLTRAMAERGSSATRLPPVAEVSDLLECSPETAQAVHAIASGKPVEVALGFKSETEAEVSAIVEEELAAAPALASASLPALPPEVEVLDRVKKKLKAKEQRERTSRKKPPAVIGRGRPARAPLMSLDDRLPQAEEDKLAAFVRERERSAWVESLKHGQKFSRKFRGEKFELVVDHKRHEYRVNGESFPTIYLATARVTGLRQFRAQDGGKRAMPAWSSKRFWAAEDKLANKREAKKKAGQKPARKKAAKKRK